MLTDANLTGADCLGVRVRGKSAYLRGSMDFLQQFGPAAIGSSLLAGFSFQLRSGRLGDAIKQMFSDLNSVVR